MDTDFKIEEFETWLRSLPANFRFNYREDSYAIASTCPIAQWLKARHVAAGFPNAHAIIGPENWTVVDDKADYLSREKLHRGKNAEWMMNFVLKFDRAMNFKETNPPPAIKVLEDIKVKYKVCKECG